MKIAQTTLFRRKRRDTAGRTMSPGEGMQTRKRPLGCLQPAHLLLLR